MTALAHHIRCYIVGTACLFILSGATPACAADGSTERIQLAQTQQAGRNKSKSSEKSSAKSNEVEFESVKNSIALLMRDLSKKTGRSIVVMNGVEPSQAGPFNKKKHTPDEWVDEIVSGVGMNVQRNPAYDFVFAPGYEVVNQTNVTSALDPAFAAHKTTLHIEFGTPLFAALALLSDSLKATLVADNVVADARCGEIHLYNVTVGDALNAMLQSARIPMQSLRIRSEDGAIFLYSAGRPLREPVRAEVPGEARPEWLDRRVTVYLPSVPAETGHLQGYGGSRPLNECLAELARQTDLHFETDTRTHSLPINPAVMQNLRLETVLDLIVNQWPLPHYGYRANGDTVRFVYLGPPITAP